MSDPDKKFPVDAPPPDWSSKTDQQKLEWLDTHGLESDPTICLGDYHRRAAKLTHIFSIFFRMIQRIASDEKVKSNPTLRKQLNAFVTALNNGAGHLSNYILASATSLLEKGKVDDEAPLLTPVVIPDLPTVDDDPAGSPSGGSNSYSNFWESFSETVQTLLKSWPWLNKVQPGMTSSYAELLKTILTTGQDFFSELRKTNDSGTS